MSQNRPVFNKARHISTSGKNGTTLPATSENYASSGVFSRGYQKIATACQSFGLDFRAQIVLDIGSSTGGFTQFALERGAKKVISIEKGTNQMLAPLRFDSRVELHEKTDIFTVSIHQSSPKRIIIAPPDLVLADVSFISLRKILSYAELNLATPKTRFLVMLKPQFEAYPDQLQNGVVKNSKINRQIIKEFETWLKTHNFHIIAKADNHLPGKNGNLERFYYLQHL